MGDKVSKEPDDQELYIEEMVCDVITVIGTESLEDRVKILRQALKYAKEELVNYNNDEHQENYQF